jgi:CRP-like cAMP-binding protein
MLSESNLSSLRYSMKEEVFYRGQYVFQEGVDPVNKIYLIRDGDFQLSKQLIKPVKHVIDGKISVENDKELYAPSSYEMAEEIVNENAFSLKKLNEQRQFCKYSSLSKSQTAEDIKVCILSEMDVFGYQELLERDIKYRSSTVVCLRNQSNVVSIEKAVLTAIVRRNPTVLEQMKQDWTSFLVERVANKLLVEQVLMQ